VCTVVTQSEIIKYRLSRSAPDSQLQLHLSKLASLSLAQLRFKWRHSFVGPIPYCHSKQQLLRSMAAQLQEDKFGGIDAALGRSIREIPTRLKRREFAKTDHALGLRPGTIIRRVWGGQRHEVVVRERDFRYRDENFQSLSAIAERITGRHRSGNAFFGLNEPRIWVATERAN
jgi:hypothetical protein